MGLRATRDYYNRDFEFIIVTTVAIVFLILIGLLRALVAPLYLICSVVLSYLSALGIGVLVFQLILGQELHWTVPGLAFIILVAVGADYNLLLISRIRDESPHGIPAGRDPHRRSYRRRDHGRWFDLCGVDVWTSVRQHQHDGPDWIRPRHRAPAGHISGAHRDSPGDRDACWRSELVAIARGKAIECSEAKPPGKNTKQP